MKIILEEIVKIMERGQITLPVSIRKELGLSPKTWLSMRLTNDKEVLLKPLKSEKLSSLSNFLKKLSHDHTIYWTIADEQKRLKIRKKSTLRLKKQALE